MLLHVINEMAGASLLIFPQRCHLKYPVWKGIVGEESGPKYKMLSDLKCTRFKDALQKILNRR